MHMAALVRLVNFIHRGGGLERPYEYSTSNRSIHCDRRAIELDDDDRLQLVEPDLRAGHDAEGSKSMGFCIHRSIDESDLDVGTDRHIDEREAFADRFCRCSLAASASRNWGTMHALPRVTEDRTNPFGDFL